jgi:hypothetical protein
MPITTIKRCQSNDDWWFTVEDRNSDTINPQTGLLIKVYDERRLEGRILISVSKEDALLIRDAINQLYPTIITR